MLRKLCIFIIFISLCGYCLWYFPNTIVDKNYLHGTVIEIIDNEVDEDNIQQLQVVNVKIEEEKYKNKIVTIQHTANLAYVNHIIVKEGDRVILWVDDTDTSFDNCRIYSYTRDTYLIYLICLFVLAVLLVGGIKGVFSIISLSVTMGLVFFMFFPLVLTGVSAISAAIAVCIVSTTITLFFIGGFCEKTYAAIIGTLGGVSFSIFLTYIFGKVMNIRGIQDENSDLITYCQQGPSLDLKELLYAGIIIGSLGAIMDVCMSIASAMDEICQANPSLSNPKLFTSGMHVGKDAIGTMSNTLILAYVGSSINLLIVFYIYQQSFLQFINREDISSEVLRAFTGSIGLIFSIPITSASYLFFRKKF